MIKATSHLDEIRHLKPGDHLCCIYQTEGEHRALLTPFLRQGLEQNEKILYIVDARIADTVLEYLRQDGLDPSQFLKKGQLSILSADKAYMRDGAFDPDCMISLLRQETDRAVKEGYRALRATGEMSWALRGLPGSERLIEYESRLNTFFPGSRCLALCQYDRRRFPASLLLQVLATHPMAVVGTEFFENVHYIPPENFLGHELSSAILDHWMASLSLSKRTKAVEDALRESEGQFRAIFENSMDGALMTTPDGNILAANPAACRMLGRTEAEVCEAGRAGVVDIADPRLPALLEERALTGMTRGELTLVRKDGTRFPVEISSRVFKDRHGDQRTSMIFRDITERVRAEEKIRESEEKYRAVVENIGDVIARFDRDCRYVYVNPGASRYTGMQQADLMGKTHEELGFPEEKARFWDAAIGEVFETGIPKELEFSLDGPSGTFWFGWRLFPEFDADGNVKTVVTASRNITEGRKLEEQLRQAQKMEAVGRLAGGIAHDFNNLLTAINGYSDLLIRQMDETDPRRREVEEIRKAGDRAASLTRQLLAFSRRQILQPKVVDLNAVVSHIENMLHRLIGEDVKLLVSLALPLWRVMADSGQIEQVIMNLAINSRDAMPAGGTLTIETANLELSEEIPIGSVSVPPGSYVALTVSDTGCGMDKATKSHLFEPFFTTKEKGKGTGLGLAMVYGIVKQSGGYILVDSEVGKGTAFKIYLPRIAGEPQPAALEIVPAASTMGNETVLVVEDQDEVRNLVEEILRMQGYHVLKASSGDEALRLCRAAKKPIDLLLTDMVMPGLSGRELAERMREISPGIKVLLMSGYAEEGTLPPGETGRGLVFIQKPFSAVTLAQKVREVLDTQ
jgi:PAS domain S-box-containing protein